ncbi:MAG: hypothetical protein ACT4PT_07115 [Methanobacteriota archaeon]
MEPPLPRPRVIRILLATALVAGAYLAVSAATEDHLTGGARADLCTGGADCCIYHGLWVAHCVVDRAPVAAAQAA